MEFHSAFNHLLCGCASMVIEKGKIVDYGTPDYIIPKYDNEEFMAEESYLEI